MNSSQLIAFGPYQLQGARGPLFRDGEEVALSPKSLAVLWALIRRAGEVVTKPELFDAVWPDQQVADAALNYQVHSLREALCDDALNPKYIATQHRVGFRFVAELKQSNHQPANPALMRPFVGRHDELTQLSAALSSSTAGQQQILFITGEAGVGKTRLTEQFISQVQREQPDALITRGHCMELRGSGEPYLPILEALDRLLRRSDGSMHIQTLERLAPNWLIQLPALLQPDQIDVLTQRVSGSGRERLHRELADALAVITQKQPLILILEDLHWADPSTIEVIKALAGAARQGQLLILVNYRPMQAEQNEYSVDTLKRDLTGRDHAIEIALGDLATDEVRHYLEKRLGILRGDMAALSAQLCTQTGGQPLLLTHVCDYLAEQAVNDVESCLALIEETPQRLHDLLELEFSKLESLDQRLLEAASVVGQKFSTAAAAAAIEGDLEAIENRCQRLAKTGQFITETGLAIWPDGTTSGRYQFHHVLYMQALRERLTKVEQAQHAQRIGLRLEAGFRDRSLQVASELADYFDTAGMIERALYHQLLATRSVLASKALAEGRIKLAKCEQLLALLPVNDSHLHAEFTLAILRVNTVHTEQGYLSPAMEGDLHFLREHLDQVNDPELESIALTLLWRYESFQSHHEVCGELAKRLTELGRRTKSPFIECTGLGRAALAFHFTGRPRDADALSTKAVAIASARVTREWGDTNVDPGFSALIAKATSQWLLGYPDTALKYAKQCIDRALGMDNPYMECAAKGMVMTTILLYRRDFEALRELSSQSMALSQQYSHRESLGWAAKTQGVALAMTGQVDQGLTILRQVITAQRAAGSLVTLTLDYTHEAEICLLANRIDEAQTALNEAFEIMEITGERLWEPEMWRIRAELLLAVQEPQITKAKECFNTALQLANERSALSLELRAATGMARLWRQQDQPDKARDMLEEVCGRIKEGQSSTDMTVAQQLLVDL